MLGRGQAIPINVLSDDVLLAIFYFYLVRTQPKKKDIEAWQPLVHVCRRWRCLVFGSPGYLDLRLVCTPKTPARESLDVWPALPLVIEGRVGSSTPVDNIIVALGHSDRVRRINLRIGNLQWDEVLAAMHVPFPALTHLLLRCDGDPSIIPDTFLGGSAPRLQYLRMKGIPFPGIPNLLLTATHLSDLYLSNIPYSGYISPEAMATCLSVLANLHTLSIEFLSSESRPDGESQHPPPMTRFILPELATIFFGGANEYLEDLVARIDTPRLAYLRINFDQEIDFHAPLAHLVQFISRTPRFQELNGADVSLNPYAVTVVRLLEGDDWRVELSCEGLDPYFSFYVSQVCTMCLPPATFRTVENLRLEVPEDHDHYLELDWIGDVEDDQWLELLHPFTAVKNLYLSEEFGPRTASTLQELVEGRTTEILPSLQNIFLERCEPPPRPVREAVGHFVVARIISGDPMAIKAAVLPL